MESQQVESVDALQKHKDLEDQLFAIRRSARYHDRRATHYERLHRSTNLVMVLLAGVVMMDFTGAEIPLFLKVVAVAGALLSAGDLVVGFSRCANLHRNLKRSFVLLERDVIEDNVHLARLQSRRLVIESEEPAIFRALDLLCHIETCAALGKAMDVHVPWYMRASSQWLHWPNAGAKGRRIYCDKIVKARVKRFRAIRCRRKSG
jgi:hypothetical protein